MISRAFGRTARLTANRALLHIHTGQHASVVSRVSPTLTRGFADGKRDSDKKQPPKSSSHDSILNEDLLAKSGMDLNGSTSSEAAASDAGAEAGTDAASAEGKGRPEWQNTAKKEGTKSSTDVKRERRSNIMYAVIAGTLFGCAIYMGRDWEDDEPAKLKHVDIPNGYAPSAVWARLSARTSDFFQFFNEPVFDKLLPDPLPEPYGRPLTLVLGLDDLLIHSEWTREHGWRTAKRPGVDYFLGYLAQYYEIVIFSSKYQVYSEKPVMALDPYRSSISYALYREASRYQKGKIIKDLTHLNRDLGKTIIVDADPDAYSLQPDNAVALKPWKGDPNDQQLVKLIPFLEWLASQPIKDVRPILKTFEGSDVPEEYARREAHARKLFEENWKKEYEKNVSGNWAAKFLGIAPQIPPTPMMPQDYIRQEGQKGYEAFQKYLQENGQKMLEEEKQREKELINSQKFTLKKIATEGMPTAEDLAAKAAEAEAANRQAAVQPSK